MKKIYVEYKNDSYEFDLSIKLDDFKNQITERFPQLKMNKFEIVFYNQNNYQILQESNYKLLYNNYRCYKVKINEEKDLKRSRFKEDKEFIEKVRNVLTNYSIRNSSIGYCQGFNFIVEKIMQVMENNEVLFILNFK